MMTSIYKFCKRNYVIDISAYLILMLGFILIILRGAEDQGYYWQWFRIPRYLIEFEAGSLKVGPILEGLKITLNIVWISLIVTYAIGLTTALMRLSNSAGMRMLARLYLETSRNTPLLVQIYFIYFRSTNIFKFYKFFIGFIYSIIIHFF